MGSKLYEMGRFINADSLVRYIEERRHEDGGYCFVSVLSDTNVNDTYYAIKIYDLLGLDFPEPERTVEFLEKTIQPQTAVVAIAMAMEGLALLGGAGGDVAREHLDIVFTKYNPLEGKFAVGLGGSEEFGTATPLEATYWVTKAFKAIGHDFSTDEREAIRAFVMKFRNGNGFGVKGPTTTMTYQALYVLHALGYRPPKTPPTSGTASSAATGGAASPRSPPTVFRPTSSRPFTGRGGLGSRMKLLTAPGDTSGSYASFRTPTAASGGASSSASRTSRTHTGRLRCSTS